MLGHRKLNVDDYLAILKRRRWLIAIPVVIFPFIAYGITFFIPAQYVSQTLILIEEQKIPDDIARSVMSSSLDSRLASMREQILSRSRLEPIIKTYSLYPSKSAEERIDLTRKNIGIAPIHSAVARSGGLPGFFISYTAGDARTAQLVCGEITTLFMNENLRARQDAAQGTTDFLKQQLEDAKRKLDDNDAKLAAFQRQYIGKLPGQENTSINMLTSLNGQLEASTQALTRMEQDKDFNQTMLAQQLQIQNAANAAGSTTSTYYAGQAEQAELQALIAQEAELSTHYTADYPDVIAIHRKIADLRKKIAAIPPPTTVTTATNTGPSRYDSPSVQQLRAQIRSSTLGIEATKLEQAKLQQAIRLYQERIESSPLVEEQYKDLTRDYDTSVKFYDGLLNQMNHSKMATDLEREQQGEQFRVMDEPNLPEGPTYPNRDLFAFGGGAVGLALGLMLAAFLEYRDTALRTEQDVWAFTHLPTLAVIAYSGEIVAQRQKPSVFTRLKGLLSRKGPKEELSKAAV
jgi:polysaccharide chain length determinant protein (PEP-CTERM system associated)